MSQIVESHFDRPDEAVELLRKSLHGGFVSDEELKDGERELCESFDWFESAVKFKCDCGEWHTAKDRESPYECPVHMRPVEPDSVRNGFRMETGTSLSLDVGIDYELEVVESASIVSISEFEDKAIVFAPDVDSLEFPDRVGRVVWLPLQSLPDIVNEEDRENIVSEIREKRENLIDWDRLGGSGNDFEEITYRLVARSDQFYDRSWGGRGPDQGKDGYCSVDTGGSGTRVLIQAKGQPESSLNKDDIRGMVQDAVSHDCEGLLVTTINITGDAETKYERGGFRTAAVPYVKIWPGVEMKERLSRHPDLIAEYFIE